MVFSVLGKLSMTIAGLQTQDRIARVLKKSRTAQLLATISEELGAITDVFSVRIFTRFLKHRLSLFVEWW